jgi:hypothetical protein
MMPRSWLALALTLATGVACERTTSITLVGEGPAPATVTDELYSLFTQLTLGMGARPKADADTLRVRAQWVLSDSERVILEGVFTKLGTASPSGEALTFFVESTPDANEAEAGGAARRERPPERRTITLDPARAERTLRSTGSIGGDLVCSWEVKIHPAVPERFAAALWDNPFLEPGLRPYRVVAADPATAPLAERLRFHEPDRAGFVFGRGVDAYSAVLGGAVPPEELAECSRKIFTQADALFLCNLVFPQTCGWLRTHSMEDTFF